MGDKAELDDADLDQIYKAGWRRGHAEGYRMGFDYGRSTLSLARGMVVLATLFAGAAVGWAIFFYLIVEVPK